MTETQGNPSGPIEHDVLVTSRPETKPCPPVSLNRFSICIPQGQAHESSNQYVKLRHMKEFSIRLSNDDNVECDCDVFLDGILMGHYRVGAKKSIDVKRPTGLALDFKFARQGSVKCFDTNLPLDPDTLGLLKVIFKPFAIDKTTAYSNVPPPLHPPENNGNTQVNAEQLLVQHPFKENTSPFAVQSNARKSEQQFQYIPALDQYDTNKTTILYVRLIEDESPSQCGLEFLVQPPKGFAVLPNPFPEE